MDAFISLKRTPYFSHNFEAAVEEEPFFHLTKG
jgi:hypothetical protein